MSDSQLPDNVWEQLFEQTPLIFRYVMTVLTLGVFALAGVLYRWHRDDMQRVHQRIDRLEKTVALQHSETNTLLFQIAQNTQRARRRADDPDDVEYDS